MTTLTPQLSIAQAYPLLVLDAATPKLHVGIIENGKWTARFESDESALESLFDGARLCFEKAGVSLYSIKGILFNQGPGSLLGLRIAVMAIEPWRKLLEKEGQKVPVWSYTPLGLTALTLGEKSGSLFTEYKRGLWHVLPLGPENKENPPLYIEECEATNLTELPKPHFHLPGRKSWESPPEGTTAVAYTLDNLPEFLENPDLIFPNPELKLFTEGSTEYKKWTPSRHR